MESIRQSDSVNEFRRAAVTTALAITPRLDSRDLLRGSREIVIRHGDQEYRLRHTQNDKLILTK